MSKLEQNLSKYLGAKFDPKIFKSEDFQDFLLNNFDDCLDIQVIKPLRSKKKRGRKTTLMVYPKNYPKYQNNFSNFFQNTQSEYQFVEKSFKQIDQNLSEFFSEKSVQKTPPVYDSFSEASIMKYFPKEHVPSQFKIEKTKNFEETDNLFAGFEYQVISPISSISCTFLNNQNEKAEDKEQVENLFENDFKDTSWKFIEMLINESDVEDEEK